MKRFDERDNMIARMNLQMNSKCYNDYYERHPEKKDIDNQLRSLPDLCSEGSLTYHPLHSRLPIAVYKLLGDINPFSEGPESTTKVDVDPEIISKKLKKFALYFGAVKVGITEMKDEFYYSHRGRKESSYGNVVTPKHKYAIVFAIEMDQDMINRAPEIEEVIEVCKGYLDAGIIGLVLANFIRELGYEARNHMDANYLVVAPLVAESAGLGQLGRIGVLVTKEYGPRIRLGIVTTNMELISDDPDDFGLPEFCKLCRRCAETCSSNAIPSTSGDNVNGHLKWEINAEACYKKWRSLGTDCGICLSACPFSQGIDLEKIKYMKGNVEIMADILKDHNQKHGVREHIKKPLHLVKD